MLQAFCIHYVELDFSAHRFRAIHPSKNDVTAHHFPLATIPNTSHVKKSSLISEPIHGSMQNANKPLQRKTDVKAFRSLHMLSGNAEKSWIVNTSSMSQAPVRRWQSWAKIANNGGLWIVSCFIKKLASLAFLRWKIRLVNGTWVRRRKLICLPPLGNRKLNYLIHRMTLSSHDPPINKTRG